MFSSLLIANRGEIACRIIEAARRLSIKTIAVYSDADAAARHVRLADEAHRLGPPSPAMSYLDIDRLIEVAQKAHAQAVHPGYGFLSESAEFATACAKAGLKFVGPPVEAIRIMGAKDVAKTCMEKAGVAVVPGYQGVEQGPAKLAARAERIGYPLLIKAVAGGGGRGMRRVDAKSGFRDALVSARREAKAAFGNDRVLLEKFIEQPRHIEVQVFADGHGHVVHLFERDCTAQRRHQKVIEEAPAPGMSEGLRTRMGAAALLAARSVDYVGAGTVEFIVPGTDTLGPDTPFYFMEMNTRLQVEHPVTECITGVDLVEWQLRVAAGEPLPRAQPELSIQGHAIEARIYAEDAKAGFLPQTGVVHAISWPGIRAPSALRIDHGFDEGDRISPFYDAMIAKLIVSGPTREAARTALKAALDQFRLAGVTTNANFLGALLGQAEFVAGRFDTGLIDRELENLTGLAHREHGLACAALAWLIVRESARTGKMRPTPFDGLSGWSPRGDRKDLRVLAVNGVPAEISFAWHKGALIGISVDGTGIPLGEWHLSGDMLVAQIGGRRISAMVAIDGKGVHADTGQGHYTVAPPAFDDMADHGAGSGNQIRAPMPGKMQAVHVGVGEKVEKGGRLGVLEAMKMEHALSAFAAGTVTDIRARPGDQVAQGDILFILEPEGMVE